MPAGTPGIKWEQEETQTGDGKRIKSELLDDQIEGEGTTEGRKRIEDAGGKMR